MMTLKRVENVEEESICEAIRRKVFIVEQGVDENLELDEHDTFGSSDYYPHYLALVDGVPAGTFRMHRLDDGSLKLQRFCVLSDYRRKGVGRQQVLGEGSRKAPLLIRYFGSCRKVYEADDIELRLSGLLTPAELQKFAQTPIDMAEEIVEACHRLRYGIITPDDENYPKRLLNIPDFPAALYYCGEWPDIDNEVVIGMVGTRIASRYGFTAATEIAKDLAACGAIVISGGARGIDTAAHQGRSSANRPARRPTTL